jgi:hypothetical protein
MADTRATTSRIATQRPLASGAARNRLDVDLTGLPDDLEAVFVREETLGQYDQGNIEHALARGLTPATTDMLPNNAPVVLPGREPPNHNLIRRGGQILMVGRKADLQAERDAAVEEGEAQIASAQRMSAVKGAEIDGRNYQDLPAQVTDHIDRPLEKRGPGRPPKTQRFAE